MSELWTPTQVAAALAVSRRTVERFIASGKLRSAKVGGQRRVARSEVERYLREAEHRGRVA